MCGSLRQVDQHAPGDRDLRGEPRPSSRSGPQHLHQERLALGENFSMGLGRLAVGLALLQMSATWRNAARSSPISMNADCIRAARRATRPMQMLPTSPRLAVRSMRSSCTTPAPGDRDDASARRDVMRISSCTRSVQPLDELPVCKAQAHHAGIAAPGA